MTTYIPLRRRIRARDSALATLAGIGIYLALCYSVVSAIL